MTRPFALLLATALFACDGCEERPGKPLPLEAAVVGVDASPVYEVVNLTLGEDGGVSLLGSPMLGQSLIMEGRLLPLAGKEDFENRYPFGLTVRAYSGEHMLMCSGSVISPHLILTAGHCVCPSRKTVSAEGASQKLIDASTCVETATVEALFYEPIHPKTQLPEGARGVYSPGSVRPHPELKILLDSQGQVVSTHADLAVIALNTPLGKEYRPVPLAGTEVQTGESIIIVGYGYDETSNNFGMDRRSCSNKVLRRLEPGGESVLVEQPGRHLYRLDSGGPCLRVGPRSTELVGVSSRSLGQGSTFISTHAYREWLQAEIQRAEKPPSGTRSPRP